MTRMSSLFVGFEGERSIFTDEYGHASVEYLITILNPSEMARLSNSPGDSNRITVHRVQLGTLLLIGGHRRYCWLVKWNVRSSLTRRLLSGQRLQAVGTRKDDTGSYSFWKSIRNEALMLACLYLQPDSPLMELIDRYESGVHADADGTSVATAAGNIHVSNTH